MTLAVVAGLLLTVAFALTGPRAAWTARATRAARGAAVVLLLVSACSTQTAAGDAHPMIAVTQSAPPVVQVPGEPGYLALGDSIVFGYRPLPSFADYRNPAAFTAYPEDVARALKLNLVNAACPGETTASMINTGAPSNGCETNAHRAAQIPPSTGMIAPVTYALPRPLRNTATPAMSSGRPMRPSGEAAAICSPCSASVTAIILDSNGPGATALTVMCRGPSSRARTRVSWCSPALLAEYE
jgi:hypothetical protein